ncbi:MAG: hypothetical protein IPJ74_25625 [Saprospiraceae bacterium]|nr:hypothetical protein [Saprospiraceae bacterium]
MEVVEQYLKDSEQEDKARTGFFAAQVIGAVPLNFDTKDKYSIYKFKKIGRDKAGKSRKAFSNIILKEDGF